MSQEKLEKVAGWGLLATLGVSYVISGDFAGWPYGVETAGWGGMLIAATLMGLMYFTLVLSQAEMATAIPAAGGGYSFARFAMGPIGGFLTGLGILIEYAFAPAAIVIFIGGYVESLTGIGGIPVYVLFYVVFVGINLLGAGEALKIMVVVTGLAVIAILITAFALIPSFEVKNLFDIAPKEGIEGATTFLPFGTSSILAALPFGIWLFLGVEGIPLAAEECSNPSKSLPKGIIVAMTFLVFSGALMLFVIPGAIGAEFLTSVVKDDTPLISALEKVFGENHILPKFINVIALAGLIASFFSLIFGCGRITFALSRAGYLPCFMSKLNKRHVPLWGLIIPAIVGLSCVIAAKLFSEDAVSIGALMLNIAVFGAALSYGMQALSHIMLRVKRPDIKRPYHTPGGVITSGIALVLSIIAFIACFLNPDMKTAVFYMLAFVAVSMTLFMIFSYKKVSQKTAEEEFSIVHDSEAELN